MIFNLEAQGGALRLLEYINKLISRRVIVEVIVKRSDKFRSSEQNRYLHLCLQFFAAQYGCSLEEVKVSFYKKEANADIFIRENDRGNAYLGVRQICPLMRCHKALTGSATGQQL